MPISYYGHVRQSSEIFEVPEVERDTKFFLDESRLRRPESLTKVFDYHGRLEPPFSLQEQLRFASAYMKTPKDFGKIAVELPGRTYADCIRHYYIHKHDSRFESASMHKKALIKAGHERKHLHLPLIAFREDELTDTENHDRGSEDRDSQDLYSLVKARRRSSAKDKIDPVGREVRKSRKDAQNGYHPRNALLPRSRVFVPVPDLRILRASFRPPFDASDQKLVRWLRSAEILPLVKDWYDKAIAIDLEYVQLQRFLPEATKPWSEQAELIAELAQGFEEYGFERGCEYSNTVCMLAECASKIAHGNRLGFFKTLTARLKYGPRSQRLAGARVLLTAYTDLRRDKDGFFGTLLRSPLAQPIPSDVRWQLEESYMPVVDVGPVVSTTRNPKPRNELPPYGRSGPKPELPLLSQIDKQSFEKWAEWREKRRVCDVDAEDD